MDLTHLQNTLSSCSKQSNPVTQVPNVPDLKTVDLKYNCKEEKTEKANINESCELCGVQGNVSKTELESGLREIITPLLSKQARKRTFCCSCLNVVLSVVALFKKERGIQKKFDDTQTEVKTILQLNGERSGSNPQIGETCKLKQPKEEIKEESLEGLNHNGLQPGSDASADPEYLSPNFETDFPESAIEIVHHAVFEVKEEPQDEPNQEQEGMPERNDASSSSEFSAQNAETGTLCPAVVEPSAKRNHPPVLLLLDEYGRRLYHCEIPNCSKTFRQEQDLLVHRKAKHQKYNTDAFTCYFCGRRMVRKDNFYEHILKKHVNELPESCIVMGCGFKAPGKLAWKTHLESKHPKEWKKWQKRKRKREEYSCSKCPWVFSEAWKFYRHTKTHDEVPRPKIQFTCEICAKSFNYRQTLKTHLVLKHGRPGKVFTCHYKDCKTPKHASKSRLNDHIKTVHVVERFTCLDCGYKFKGKAGLKAHCRHSNFCAQQAGREISFKWCPHCPKSFADKISLKRHIQIKHVTKRKYKNDGEEGALKCYFCEYVTGSRKFNILYEHIAGDHLGEFPLACGAQGCSYRTAVAGLWRGHVKRYHEAEWEKYQKQLRPTEFKCPHCPKVFSRSSYLRIHKQKHRPDRIRYQCQECEKSFAKQQSLNEHLISQHGQGGTVFPCPYKSCKSKLFPNKSNLKYHIERVHNEEEVACKHCDRTFKNVISLKEHQQSRKACAEKAGKAQKLTPCSFPGCSKAFFKPNDLQRHIAWAHTPRVKEKCGLCGNGFASLTALGKHMVEEHGGVPCDLCGKACDGWRAFTKHRSRVHGNRTGERKGRSNWFKHKFLECYFCKEKVAGDVLLEKHLRGQQRKERESGNLIF